MPPICTETALALKQPLSAAKAEAHSVPAATKSLSQNAGGKYGLRTVHMKRPSRLRQSVRKRLKRCKTEL